MGCTEPSLGQGSPRQHLPKGQGPCSPFPLSGAEWPRVGAEPWGWGILVTQQPPARSRSAGGGVQPPLSLGEPCWPGRAKDHRGWVWLGGTSRAAELRSRPRAPSRLGTHHVAALNTQVLCFPRHASVGGCAGREHGARGAGPAQASRLRASPAGGAARHGTLAARITGLLTTSFCYRRKCHYGNQTAARTGVCRGASLPAEQAPPPRARPAPRPRAARPGARL